MHIILSSHCHAHWILYTALLAQRELEAQEKIPIVPLSDLQVGNIYIGHMIASVKKMHEEKKGGGFTFKYLEFQNCF